MSEDQYAVARAARKPEVRTRLNRPRIVSPFPAADLSSRMDEAVMAWWRDIFEYFDVDPTGAHCWEQIAWRLAGTLYPNFKIIGTSNIGAPRTQELTDELLALFEAYVPPEKGSAYKQFLGDHDRACQACDIKGDNSLRDAIFRARRRRERNKANEEVLIRFETMKAMGVSPISLISKSSV